MSNLNLKKIFEALALAQTTLLNNKNNDNHTESKREAEYLLSYSLGWSKTKLIAYPDYYLTPEEFEKFSDILTRRTSGEPMAYIKKSKSFWNIDLEIDNSVLIPRPETELLVEKILNLNLGVHAKILDLGTGSGAIAIALGVNQPNWTIVAIDLSKQALDIAKKNAQKYDLKHIEFYLGSWFNALPLNSVKFDIIVSNPPYIDPASDYLSLGDVQFEPIQALVSKNHGLADLDYIIMHAKKYINQDGWLLVEHGYDQAAAVQAMFLKAGFIKIQTLKDIQGHNRVTYGQAINL